jgi:hypothetical protein
MYLSRFVLPAVLFLGSAVPFLAPTAAQAAEGPRREYYEHNHEYYRYQRHYEVMYRRAACEPWRCFGRFDSGHEARCAAERLEHRGFEVCIEH